MTDAEIALAMALFVTVIFAIATFGQRFRPAAAEPAALQDAGTAKSRLDVMSEQMGHQGERLQDVEHDLRNVRTMVKGLEANLPSKDLVHRLEVQLAEVRGQISTVGTTSLANQRALERIENFLLERAKGPS